MQGFDNEKIIQLAEGFAKENKIKIAKPDLDKLVTDDSVRNSIISAGKTIFMSRMLGGNGSNAVSQLLTVAERILEKAPSTKLSKEDIAMLLKEYIAKQI